MIFYKILIYFQIVSLRPYDVLDDSLINFFDHYHPSEYFTTVYGCWKTFKNIFETKTDLSEAQKTTVFQALKTHYRSIIFQKMRNSAFSCNKNGLVGRGML